MPALRIHGHIYHNMGDINPAAGQRPIFLQTFFHDSSPNLEDQRIPQGPLLQEIILKVIAEAKVVNNFYVTLKDNLERLRNVDIPTYRLIISDTPPPNLSLIHI